MKIFGKVVIGVCVTCALSFVAWEAGVEARPKRPRVIQPSPSPSPSPTATVTPTPAPTATVTPVPSASATPFSQGAPAVTAVSGTFSHGQSVTISGSGFGTRAAAAPIVWDSFKSGFNGDPLSSRGWLVDSDNAAGDKPQLSNTITRFPAALFSAKFHYPRNSVNALQDLAYRENLPVSGARRYVDFWIWFQMPVQSSVAPDSLQHQLKLVKLQSGPSSATGTGYPVINTYAWRYAAGNRAVYNEVGADLNHTYANGLYWNSVFNDGAWNHVSLALDTGTAGNFDGQLKVWLNGKQVLASSAVNFLPVGFSGTAFNNLQIGKYLGNTALSTTETTIFYGEIYYDDSWSRVVICDNPVYSSCSHSEIQPFTSWSDGSIRIEVNQGSFFTGATAWLYVVSADGVASAAQPITF